MAIPVRHINLLSDFVSNSSHPAWARDLVCLSINTGGQLSDDDKLLIWEECDTALPTPSQSISSAFGSPFPKVELLKLMHIDGINALAPNQEMVFCDEGITLLYGQNRSGKSGYFRILNQLASGTIVYPLLTNIYSATPASIDVAIEYKLDGVIQPPFHWDGISSCPGELRHIRSFDSKYASMFLHPREGNTYLFDSYNLRVFRAINETLLYLKNDMGAAIDPGTEASLTSLCTTSYKDILSHALIDEFREELKKLGMGNLSVDLLINDLLTDNSQIKISLSNGMSIDSVLSEAELKCAALALFFAECNLMEVKQPIIFDDPVNSLDASIIQYFSNRIRDLDCEVVVFTHNVLLMEALTDKRHYNIFFNSSDNRARPQYNKKHILFYNVLTNSVHVGYVVGGGEKKTRFYLDSAQRNLSIAGPVTDINCIVADLRMAAEWAIDEVVFRGLPTRRYKGAENTNWTTMANMVNAGDANVWEIKRIYDQLSGMGAHLGYSSYSSTPSISTLQTLHDDLLNVYTSVYP